MANEYITALKNYAEFSGRSTRTEYWMFALYNLLITLAIMAVDAFVFRTSGKIHTLYSLAVFLPSIAVGVRRMHDAGRNGWWIIVPIANLIFACQPSVDPDSPEPKKLSGWAIAAIVLFALLPIVGIIAAIAIPAYQTITVKAQMAQVMVIGKQAELSVENYLEKNGTLPVDINQTEFNATSKLVRTVTIDPDTNDLVLTLNLRTLQGKKIILHPAPGPRIAYWTCYGAGIDEAYLPENCGYE